MNSKCISGIILMILCSVGEPLKSVYVKKNKAKICPPSISTPRDFLMENPLGAYTCIRTFSKKVAMYDFNLKRLVFSVAQMEGTDPKITHSFKDSLFCDQFDDNIKNMISKGLQHFWDVNEIKLITSEEAMITILCYPSASKKLESVVHVTSAPCCSLHGVNVRIYGQGREKAEAKLSQWCWERKQLEIFKTEGVYEIILSKPSQHGNDRELLEGLVTNLFLIRDGTVYTAQEGILFGQMRDVALEVCRQIGLNISTRPPKLSEIDTFDEAFLTGTGRIIVPISMIEKMNDVDSEIAQNDGPNFCICSTFSSAKSDSLTSCIKERMLLLLSQRSEMIGSSQ